MRGRGALAVLIGAAEATAAGSAAACIWGGLWRRYAIESLPLPGALEGDMLPRSKSSANRKLLRSIRRQPDTGRSAPRAVRAPMVTIKTAAKAKARTLSGPLVNGTGTSFIRLLRVAPREAPSLPGP